MRRRFCKAEGLDVAHVVKRGDRWRVTGHSGRRFFSGGTYGTDGWGVKFAGNLPALLISNLMRPCIVGVSAQNNWI